MAKKKDDAVDQAVYTKSAAERDLEARLADGYEPDSVINSGVVVVNPNPFGSGDYAGTDPMYQNHANDTEKPYRATEGTEKKSEDLVRDLHKFSEDDTVVDSPATGGKAVQTQVEQPVQSMNAADYMREQE